MITKEEVRMRICAGRQEQRFPLKEFITWAEQRYHLEIAHVLGELQKDLQEDEQLWREAGVAKEVQRTRVWRSVVERLRFYYLEHAPETRG